MKTTKMSQEDVINLIQMKKSSLVTLIRVTKKMKIAIPIAHLTVTNRCLIMGKKISDE